MTPEEEALNLLDELGICELPIVPKEICRKLDIFYVEERLKGFEGALVIGAQGKKSLITVNSAISQEGRKHFTAAHELGHLCMDAFEQKEFHCTKENIETFRKQVQPMELRANRFAAELLMPTPLFRNLVDDHDPDWDFIKSLTVQTATTLLATAKRLIDLTEEASVLIVSKDSAISWFNASRSFKAFIDMDSRLISPNTVAYGVHRGKIPPNNFEVVKADNWVTGRDVNPNTEILEWTLPMNSYGQVLTILFDEGGISGRAKEDAENHWDDEVSSEWEPMTFHKSKRKG